MPCRTADEQRAYQRAWLARRRAAYFSGKACVQCGADEELHLHHVDPATKVANSIWSWSQERRDVELAKCTVLCRSCHEDHHARQLERHGSRSRYQRGCRCGLCRWAKSIANTRYRGNRLSRMAQRSAVAAPEDSFRCNGSQNSSADLYEEVVG